MLYQLQPSFYWHPLIYQIYIKQIYCQTNDIYSATYCLSGSDSSRPDQLSDLAWNIFSHQNSVVIFLDFNKITSDLITTHLQSGNLRNREKELNGLRLILYWSFKRLGIHILMDLLKVSSSLLKIFTGFNCWVSWSQPKTCALKSFK